VISVDADADAVRYAYVVDGAAPVDSADPWFTIESVTAGEHVVSVRAFNADDLSTGNYTVGFDVAEAPAVDETAPVVTITTKPDLEWTSSAATFEWSVEDDDADITSYWSMDGSEPEATDLTSWEFAGESSLEDGEHTFEVWAQDSTGNVSDPVSYTFTITTGDDTPVVVVPTIAFTSTPAASTTSTTAHFVVEATEGSTIEYILDLPEGAQSATPLPVNGNELTFTDLAVGHHHLMVGATLGDQFSGVLEYEWDVVAPAVVTPPAPAAPAAPANPVAPVILASDAIPAAQITNGISAGASGPSVAIIQRVVGTPADGRFGRLTSAAVRAFQRAHGLVADGVVGPLTWAAIVDVANGGAGVTPVTPTSVPRAVILRGVTHGAHGQAVATIQRVLGVSADGRFGPQTTAAVRAFQRAHGLVVDGIVGRLTWAAMVSR
jgi:peptidoglycan hydrolase-like protein with peptidoglycan-binding domain